MKEVNKRYIVTVNLKYGSSSKPLKTVAFAELAAKVLFFCGNELEIDKLILEAARLIGVKNISKDLIEEGLNYLKEQKRVVENEQGLWILQRETIKEIRKDLDLSRILLNKVLTKHFINTMERRILKGWFKEAIADFFGYFGDEWVRIVSKAVKPVFPPPQTIEELLSPSIKKYNLDSEKNVLIAAFIDFISSEDAYDKQYLMLISQAMFSTRLVAADIGVDPITLEELRDAKFILDTNVLLSLALESSKFSKSIISLEEALKIINSKLIYLYTTQEEYNRVLTAKRAEILNLVDKYPNEVIQDIATDFIITAKNRGCILKEDYERFFDSLVNLPSYLPNGYKIVIEDNADIEKIKNNAEKDSKLKDGIQKYAVKMRAKWKGPKSEAALNHDSALIHVTDYLKSQGEKCWILSLDRSLQACSVNQAGPRDMPSVLSVTALVEILAINNAGPAFDVTDFAPLLAKIILNECCPPLNTYTIQDLQWLLKINEKAADMPAEVIKKMLRFTTAARIKGKTCNDVDLQLNINRIFQEEVPNINKYLEEARDRVKVAEEAAEKERLKRQTREDQYILIKVKEIKRQALFKLIKTLIIKIIFALIISSVIFLTYWLCFDRTNKQQIIWYIISVLSFLIAIWKPLPQAFSDYKKSCKEAKETASKELI